MTTNSHEFHDISMTSEDARTIRRLQYAVRLTYNDGRIAIHIRENEMSARSQVEIHRMLMVQESNWGVVDAEVVHRWVEMTLGQWEEAS